MRPPLDYHRECGPTAVATILDIDPQDAAEQLWPLRAFWWNWTKGTYRPGKEPGKPHYGTPERAVEDLLLRHGCLIDTYSPEGPLAGDTRTLAQVLREEAQRRALGARVAPAAKQDEGGSDLPPEDTEVITSTMPPDWWLELRSLSWWQERFRVAWLLFYLAHRDGVRAHVLTGFGWVSVSGNPGEIYHHPDWRVYRVLRVHRPQDQRLT
jgi:hypothetical protein